MAMAYIVAMSIDRRLASAVQRIGHSSESIAKLVQSEQLPLDGIELLADGRRETDSVIEHVGDLLEAQPKPT